MNQHRSFVVLFAVVMLLGSFVFSASAQEGVGEPTLTPTPTVTPEATMPPPRLASAFFANVSADPVAIGTEFTFELGLDVENIRPGVSGAEVYISYRADLVAPVASPGRPIVEVLPDFFGVANVSVNEITTCSGPDGAASCAHLVVAGPAQTTKRGAIARYHFRPTAEGEICFTLLSVALADADGYPVTTTPTPPPTTRLCINNNPVLGTVLRQGTPGNPNPGGGTLMCSQVKLISGTTVVTDTNVNGEFRFNRVTVGSYAIEASYSGYLTAKKSFVTSAGKTPVGTVRLLGGDVNGDCAINMLDFGSIISKFGASGVEVQSDLPDCADSDEPRDINDDSNVNIGDLAIAASNMGKVCLIPWLP